ncbi:AAA family ATPase [Microbacterium luteolum]|uniref:AAA family ATPase n=1 Tax=Microbacterium luteolum TaxID=69367 RepID=A0ABY7XTX0_MICLT|nr:AAA family ATPase [Microbacterium luteolum]WDM45646.1 AAA family ATPase [Microbacterium luteolum]
MSISDWRQFGEVSIRFHPRLTTITGANASGKSTLIAILARHFSWTRIYSSSPARDSDATRSWANLGPRRMNRWLAEGGQIAQVGSLQYADGGSTAIQVPVTGSSERQGYEVQLRTPQDLAGVFINSHRTLRGNYVVVPSIPTAMGSAEQMLEQYTTELRNQWMGQFSKRPSQLALKEGLIAAALFGGFNLYVDRSPEATNIWEGFQAVLANLLPKELGFRRLNVRMPEVVVETTTGDFVLDEVSGGLSAVIDIAWQIFLKSRDHRNFVVLLDEPENHLHPSLQRELLPGLLHAFPRAQFIVATHSPFVVTAIADSTVYVLDHDEDRRITARRLDYVNMSASADETLTRVLGLQSTLPIWAESRYEEILAKHMTGSLTLEQLTALREDLKASGLEGDFPDAVSTFIDEQNDRTAQ